MSHVPSSIVPAVEVRDLRKEFRRRSRRKDESRFKRQEVQDDARPAGRQLHHAAR